MRIQICLNYLPVMDFRNASIPADKVNMMDVNKAIQRCTVKAIALHGLGLYIYAGEDLPEEPQRKQPSEQLKECNTLAELASVFKALTRTEQTAMITLKDELKSKLS